VLAGQTPFYRIPYHLFPMISKTRAASMMWGHVALCMAVLASFGLARLQAMPDDVLRRWAKRVAISVGAGAAVLTAAAGGLITSLAVPGRLDAAYAAVPGARVGVLLGATTVLLFALAAWRLPRHLGAVAVVLLLSDLGVQARRFIVIDERGAEVFAADDVVQAIERDAAGATQPWRVVPMGRVYMDDYLMEHQVRSVLGYHGNEPHHFDETFGGKNVWTHLGNPQSWRLLAVRYLLFDQPLERLPPDWVVVTENARTWLGEEATVIRVPDPAPWAVVSPGALKLADDVQVRATVMDPRFDPARLTVVPGDAPFGVATPLTAMPNAISPAPRISVEERQPGVYVLTLDSLVQDGVLVVSENWMPTWTATVDGRAAPIARANGTFIGVPVPAGAREVVLAVESPADRRGMRASFLGAAGLALFALSGLVRRRTTAVAPA
jgi:hypothetical protein